MARIPDHIIDQVRDAHDIVEVVQRTVPLKRAGSGYKGLCPFHDEKTPSFTVHPDRQTFKCFGCGKGGNVFGWLTETQGLNFPEAVRQLAEERGIEVPTTGRSDPEQDERFETIRKVLGVAHRFFVRALGSDEGREARAYLERRGYDADAQRQFGLGFAPAAWDRLLEAAAKSGFKPEDLEAAGLVIPRREGDGFYDRFRHRVMFPIADARGRLCTFAGRAMDPDDPAKYMNGPETLVFRKSEVLYALHRARESIRRRGEALLMEGYTDVLMCHLHGFDHAVAGMGTAFTDRQARHLARHCERVILVYDADDAGRAAAEKSLDILLREGLEVRVALLPEGRDVDEILLEDGTYLFQQVLDASLELFEFKLQAAASRYDLDTPRGRAKASEEILASVVQVKSELERDQLISLIAERLGGGMETQRLLHERAAALQGRPSAPPTPGPRSRAGSPVRSEKPPTIDGGRAELDLLAALLALPELRDAIFRAVGPEEFADPVRSRLYNALLAHWEAGEPITFEATLARFQADPEATAILAGLPEDSTLAERVTSWIAFTEQHRSAIDHRRETMRLALGESAEEEIDPDASYYDDDGVDDAPDGNDSVGG